MPSPAQITQFAKMYAAQELAKIAWDKAAKHDDRLLAAHTLQRQLANLIASLEND
jgi:hypothetical protein